MVCHIHVSIIALGNLFQSVKSFCCMLVKSKGNDSAATRGVWGTFKRWFQLMASSFRVVGISVMVSVILYAPIDEATTRVCVALCIIFAW